MLVVNTHAVVAESEVPMLFARLMGRECDGGALACIRDGVVCQATEDTIHHTRSSVDDDIVGSVVNEIHILFLQLKSCFLNYLLYGQRHVDFLEFHHLTAVVHAVEHRYVVEQTAESFALRVASIKELRLGVFLDGGVVDDGFEIALDTCHGSLEFVGDVLCELPLQYVLLFLGLLQSDVYFYDTL